MLLELHAHTYYSHGTKVYYEGLNSPESMVKAASKLGLDGIAITDHNRIKGALEALKYSSKYGIMVIPGEEINTKDGHLIGLGINELIKPGKTVEETINRIHEQGGISIAPHPFDVKGEGIGKKAIKCDAIEIFNSLNLERASNRKNLKFIKKVKKPYVVGSDAHNKEMIGYSLNKVKGKTIEKVLDSIKKGKTKVVMDYIPIEVIRSWAIKRFQLSYNYTSNYIKKNYSRPKSTVSNFLLSTVKRPEAHKNFFKFLSCFGFYGSVLYGFLNYFKPL